MLRHTAIASIFGATLFLSMASLATAQDEPRASKYPEPEVKRIVVEDDNARIDELRIRGQTKTITVHPKRGGPAYEIHPLDPTKNPPNSADGNRLAGQRVWNVLAF